MGFLARLRTIGLEVAVGLVPVVVVTGLATAWTLADHSPPHDDDYALFRVAACMAEKFPTDPGLASTGCGEGTPYPPLVPLLAALAFHLVGDPSVDTAMLSMLPWYALLAAALYAGARAENGRIAAIAAALTGPGLWLLAGLRHAFYTELAMAATGVLALAALAHSDGLKRLGPSGLVGVAVALGMLTKWSFAFYFAAPVAVATAVALALTPRLLPLGLLLAAVVLAALGLDGAWILGRLSVVYRYMVPLNVVAALGLLAALGAPSRHLREGGQQRIRSVVGMLVAASLLSAPWYLAMRNLLTKFLTANLDRDFAGDPLSLAQTWPYYPAVLLSTFGLPLLLAAAAGVSRSVFPKRSLFLLSCLLAAVVGAAVLAVLPYRSARYLSPIFPLLAPAILLLGGGPRWLDAWRGLISLWAVLFQALCLSGSTALDLLRFGGPLVSHIPGNNLSGMEQSRKLLVAPPFTLRTQGDIPFSKPPGVDQMLNTIEELAGGVPVTLLIIDGPANLRMPMQAELVRHGRAPDAINIEMLPFNPKPEQILQRTGDGELFFAEMWDPDFAQEAELAAGRAMVLRTTWTVVWEQSVQLRTRRQERLWRHGAAPPG